jgi:FixJ family two-component response regulator
VTTVAVIDDDPSVRRGLERLLRSVGYRVETFGSARDFLACPDRAAACLVLDVSMPGQTGFDLQRRLAEQGRDIPIVFITGHGDLPTVRPVMPRGTVDLIAKPFDDAALLDAVRAATTPGPGLGARAPAGEPHEAAIDL